MSLKPRGSVSGKMHDHLEKALHEQHEKEVDETIHDTTLSHCKQSEVPKKDFSEEVRGRKDIHNFVERSEVLLDLEDTQLEPIVDKMLDAMMESTRKRHTTPLPGDSLTREPKVSACESWNREEFKSLIFSNAARTILTETIQGSTSKDGVNYDWEQTWLCAAITIPTLRDRHVAIARLRHATNLGPQAEECHLFVLIICPSEVKGTKNALETGRTFATLFSDIGLRHDLLQANSVIDFKELIRNTSNIFAEHQAKPMMTLKKLQEQEEEREFKWYHVGKGVLKDLRGRLPYYWDDYTDGVIGQRTVAKTCSTTLFLYFSIILPCVALGVLNDKNTHHQISVQQVIVGQTIGAITFALFAGQPLVVVMTTAPLALFTKIIYEVSELFEADFLAFNACVGLWNSFFLFMYSFFNLSVLMRYSSRSTEEIFSNFITIAFIADATKNMVASFNEHYWATACASSAAAVPAASADPGHVLHPLAALNGTDAVNGSVVASVAAAAAECHPEVSFLSLILMLGTVWLGVTMFEFTKTPYLTKTRRELLSDYALPVAVVVFSIVGRALFSDVRVQTFNYPDEGFKFTLAPIESLSVGSIFGAMGLGFSLSLLFFMDQNISAAMVNSPDNKLRKGNAYHWDLLVVGLINGFLTIFGLPFMHAVLPHSPLHVKCLADTEERVEGGYVRDVVVRVRETRLTTLLSNVMIGFSMLFLGDVLDFIPAPVLDGLFLYMALTALYGNQMFERIELLFTEQSAYPPNHYIRRVPQRKIHIFTACQTIQLVVLCVFGFLPYIKTVFPIIILLFLPVRHMLIPLIVDKKYLDVLDGAST